MAEHDGAIRYTERTRSLDVFKIASAQEFGAHQADERHPGEQQKNPEQHEETGHQNGRDDQQEIESRHRSPNLDEALKQEIGPAAEISLHRSGGHADNGGNDGERQSEQHREAKAIDQTRDHIAPLVVGTKPVVFEVAAAGEALALDDGFALLLAQEP